MLPFQTPQLSLEDPAGQPRSASPQSFLETAGNTRELHTGDGLRLRQSFAIKGQDAALQSGSTPHRGFTDMQPLPKRPKTRAGKASPPPIWCVLSRASPCAVQSSNTNVHEGLRDKKDRVPWAHFNPFGAQEGTGSVDVEEGLFWGIESSLFLGEHTLTEF